MKSRWNLRWNSSRLVKARYGQMNRGNRLFLNKLIKGQQVHRGNSQPFGALPVFIQKPLKKVQRDATVLLALYDPRLDKTTKKQQVDPLVSGWCPTTLTRVEMRNLGVLAVDNVSCQKFDWLRITVKIRYKSDTGFAGEGAGTYLWPLSLQLANNLVIWDIKSCMKKSQPREAEHPDTPNIAKEDSKYGRDSTLQMLHHQ